jgi:hypothetical protein
VLRTRSPLIPGPKPGSPFDLHVLSTPPAFVLSQDQTLRRDMRSPGLARRGSGVRIHLEPADMGRHCPADRSCRARPGTGQARYCSSWVGAADRASPLTGYRHWLLSHCSVLKVREATTRHPAHAGSRLAGAAQRDGSAPTAHASRVVQAVNSTTGARSAACPAGAPCHGARRSGSRPPDPPASYDPG